MGQESSTGSRTTAQRYGLAKDLTVRELLTALTAMGAFIKIAILVGAGTMNFTPQWFFVLLAGLLLDSRRTLLSVSAYLLIGLVEIPVFTRGGGPSYLIRPTFGFLLGSTLAACMMRKLVEWMHAVKPGVCLFSATVGYVVCYGMGILYFHFITHFVVVVPDIVGWGAIFTVYCLSTMIPDYILCILAATVAGRLCPSMGRLIE